MRYNMTNSQQIGQEGRDGMQPSLRDASNDYGMVTFRAPWYLRSGHIQTILTAIHKPKVVLPRTDQHAVPIGEYGATYIYDNCPVDCKDSSQAVIMLHGLGSSHGGTYMSNIAARLVSKSIRVIRIDLPGSGPSANLTWLPAHAGCSGQVETIMNWCHDHLQIRSWIGVGFSLGGNILMKLLAEKSAELRTGSLVWSMKKAIAVAPPIDLVQCSDGMQKGFNRFYAGYFLKILQAEVRRRSEHWPQWAAIDLNPVPKTIREFDDRFTSKMAGYANAEDYYRRTSSGPMLDQVITDTTFLCDKHDPVVPASIFEQVKNPKIKIVLDEPRRSSGYIERTSEGRLRRWPMIGSSSELWNQTKGRLKTKHAVQILNRCT